jgi:HK97 family phage prohead protease
MLIEHRTLAGEELRVDTGEKGRIIRGSLKFNSLSVPLGVYMRFREKIAPEAFDSVLNDEAREVMAYWGHDVNKPLGRRSAGTLRLSKTDTLLKFEADAPDTTWGRDAVAAIERGDVQGMSFRFRVLPEGERWEEDKDRNLIRTLTNVDLQEVSPTAEPAYEKSSASVRSAQEVYDQHEQEIAKREATLAEIRADRQRRDRLIRGDLRRIPN